MKIRDIVLTVIGLILISLRLIVNFGSISVDIFSDFLAFVLFAIACAPYFKEDSFFGKKTKIALFAALALNLLAVILPFLLPGSSMMSKIQYGLSAVAAIYFTYYHMLDLVRYAGVISRSAVTRSLMVTWTFYGLIAFAAYFADFSGYMVVSMVLQGLLIIYALYYSSVIYKTLKNLS